MTAEEVIRDHNPLAVKVAVKYSKLLHSKSSYHDLLQECLMSLMDAARTYNGKIPWGLFATIVMSRRARRYCRHENRGGLTARGRIAEQEKGVGAQRPRMMFGMDMKWPTRQILVYEGRYESLRMSQIIGAVEDWFGKDSNEVKVVRALADGCCYREAGLRIGLSRQRVVQLLVPVRAVLADLVALENGTFSARRVSRDTKNRNGGGGAADRRADPANRDGEAGSGAGGGGTGTTTEGGGKRPRRRVGRTGQGHRFGWDVHCGEGRDGRGGGVPGGVPDAVGFSGGPAGG